MEKANFSMVEEGGLTAYVDLEKEITKIILKNPKIACPDCNTVMSINGRCKTCQKCGWSSCDV